MNGNVTFYLPLVRPCKEPGPSISAILILGLHLHTKKAGTTQIEERASEAHLNSNCVLFSLCSPGCILFHYSSWI